MQEELHITVIHSLGVSNFEKKKSKRRRVPQPPPPPPHTHAHKHTLPDKRNANIILKHHQTNIMQACEERTAITSNNTITATINNSNKPQTESFKMSSINVTKSP